MFVRYVNAQGKTVASEALPDKQAADLPGQLRARTGLYLKMRDQGLTLEEIKYLVNPPDALQLDS